MELRLQETESESNHDVFFNNRYLGYIYVEVDGFWVFNPYGDGYWSEFTLRMIADKLEELNKSHNEKIEEYFKNNK
jgi:hypothetical protein